MKLSVLKFLTTGALAGLVGLMLFTMLYSPEFPARSAQTKSRLAQAELVVRIVEADNSGYLERFTNSPVGTIGLYGAWQKLVDDNRDLIGMEREKARDILCMDAWTNQFNVLIKTQLPEERCARRLLHKQLPIVIWSSGPNRSNEFGKGDDVIYEGPTTIAQPDGPANGSQPIRSESNRTSVTAGSRR